MFLPMGSTADKYADFGAWLKRQVEDSGETFTDWAGTHGFSVETLRGWMRQTAPNIRGRFRRRLAEALGISREQLDAAISGVLPENEQATRTARR